MLSLLRKAQIKGFQNVAGYGLSIAPEFVDAFEVGETAGNPNVATFFLVTRIKGMAGRPLIPLMEGFGLLDEGAKQAAMEDIQRLAEAGWKMSLFAFIHPDKTWFVTAGDHRLVCPCVIGFDKLQTGEKERYLQRCRDLLFHNKALARR